ncbi:hypothetical protein EDB84DRAFT_1441966 [Lactarius hengduanensis]|nr:hypothetical protein EDB84DRAFT_1441966 [Lactarius hengduanensis]
MPCAIVYLLCQRVHPLFLGHCAAHADVFLVQEPLRGRKRNTLPPCLPHGQGSSPKRPLATRLTLQHWPKQLRKAQAAQLAAKLGLKPLHNTPNQARPKTGTGTALYWFYAVLGQSETILPKVLPRAGAKGWGWVQVPTTFSALPPPRCAQALHSKLLYKGLLYYKARCVTIAPRRCCIATADCRVVAVVVVAVCAAVVAAVITAVVAVVAAVVVATVAAVVATVAAIVTTVAAIVTTVAAIVTTVAAIVTTVAAIVATVAAVVATVAAVIVVESLEESELQRRPWRRLAITPAAAVMGAAAVAFGTCVVMMLAVGRSARAGEVVVVGCRLCRVMPVLFSLLLTRRCRRQRDDNNSDNNNNNKVARRRRHDELDDHQPPPPPTGPCHRQRQDDVNNSNDADSNDDSDDDDSDDDDSDDDTDNNDKTTTMGHENNWT